METWKTLVLVASLATLIIMPASGSSVHHNDATEAPTGFDTPTLSDNPGSQSTSNGMSEPSGDTFAEDQATFEEEEGVDKGLGPVYNARSCVDCHQNPVTGGVSQVSWRSADSKPR